MLYYAVSHKVKKVTRRVTGQGRLGALRAVKVVLENGDQVTINAADQLSIPDTKIGLIRAARMAPALYAFWSHQCDRALTRVRMCERALEKVIRNADILWRQHVDEGTLEPAKEYLWKSGDYNLVERLVRGDKEVLSSRHDLDEARDAYELYRTVRNAMEQRCFMIRQLLRIDESVKPT